MKKISKRGGFSKPRISFNDRIEDIYTKAARCFAQNGYRNTSMDEVAEEVRLKKGGLYHYLESKEMLLFEIISRTLDIFLERAKRLPMEGKSPKEKLRILIDEYTRTLIQYHNEITLMLFDIKYLRPKLRDVIYSKRMRYEKLFYSVIDEGISKNVFIQHGDTETLGFLIIGAIFNLYLWHPAELKEDPQKKIESFSNFFLKGLLGK